MRKSPRDTCEMKARCGETGHYRDPSTGEILRCACLEMELNQREMGYIYCANPIKGTNLKDHIDKSLLLEGPWETLKRHCAGAVLDLLRQGGKFLVIDAYRLIDIFLEKDVELENTWPIVRTDLLIVLLGFGDIKNQRLPDCLLQVYARRELEGVATWTILGMDRGRIADKYNQELACKLETLKKMTVK